MSADTAAANETGPEQQTGPESHNYIPIPVVRIRKLRVQSMDIPLSLMVDDTGRVLVPQNVPTNAAFPQQPVSKSWKKVGKHTFRLVIHYYPFTDPSSRDAIEHMGTAIHIGQGLFLTNIHVMRWVRIDSREELDYTNQSHKARIWLFSGKGYLDTATQNPKDPGFFSKGSLEVEVIGWSPEALAHASSRGVEVRGGLMDARYRVPVVHDFCLLAPVSKRWERKLQKTKSPIHPESLSLIPTITFPATLVAINGSLENINKYNLAVNTPAYIKQAIEALHPGKVTFASTNQAIKSLTGPGRIPAPTGTNGEIIRYCIGSTGGSSGSGIYNSASGKLVGIHTYAEHDPTHNPDAHITSTSSHNYSVAISLTSPAFVNFARTTIIPTFERMGTTEATELLTMWTAFCDSAI